MIIPAVLIAVALGMLGARLYLRSPAGVKLVANMEKARRDRVRHGGRRSSRTPDQKPKSEARGDREPKPPKDVEPPDGYGPVLD